MLEEFCWDRRLEKTSCRKLASDAKKAGKADNCKRGLRRTADFGNYSLHAALCIPFRDSHALSEVYALINTYYVMGAAVNTTLIAGFSERGGTAVSVSCATPSTCGSMPSHWDALAAFVLKLPVLWVYFLLCTDEFVKWPWVIKHYRSGKWLKNITREHLFEENSPVTWRLVMVYVTRLVQESTRKKAAEKRAYGCFRAAHVGCPQGTSGVGR